MERITGNEVKSMMEAYASVYINEEVDQEVISEEVEELDEQSRPSGQQRAAIRAQRRAAAAEEDRLYRAGGGDAKRRETRQMQGASRARVRRPGMTRDQVIELGRKNLAAKSSTAPAAPANNAAASKAPAPKPAANPNVTAGGTKFERRLPTMAELRAAQKARAAGGDAEAQVKAAVNAGKPAAAKPTAPTGGAVGSAAKPAAAAAKPTATAVGSAAKPAAAAAKPTGSPAAQAAAGAPNRKEDLFTGKPIPSAKPTGSPAAQAAAGAPNRKEDLFTGKPIPSAKPAGGATAVGSAAAKPAQPAVRTGNINLPATRRPMARPGARNRMRMEELDIFDTIKEYLIGEGATEEEALKQMLTLTDEQRTEILEGSCGSKPKKKGGYKK